MEGERGKPEGGFCFIAVRPLLAAWWSYKHGVITLADFRVWLASFELVARRCRLARGRSARYALDELARLVGGAGGEHTRRSVAALCRAGLLRWSETAVEHTCPMKEMAAGEGTPFGEMLAGVTNNRRLMPVPRRLLRLLAAANRPSVVATALGHALRCLYYRGGCVRADGLCKSSWVAEVFGVDERSVKRARQQLAAAGVLKLGTASQGVLNRFGLPVTFDLSWRGPERRMPPPPRSGPCVSELSPPHKTGNSLARSQNQEPGSHAGLRGVQTRTGTRTAPGRTPGPTMDRVARSDLEQPVRLLELLDQSTRAGWTGPSENDRLRFFAAAQRALRCGTRNPGGFFAAVVRRGLWDYLTLEDEDRGRRAHAAARSTVVQATTADANERPKWAFGVVDRLASMARDEVRRLVEQSLSDAEDSAREHDARPRALPELRW